MAHLKKSSTTGHLLKSSTTKHLVNACGAPPASSSSSSEPPPSSSTEPPTSSDGGGEYRYCPTLCSNCDDVAAFDYTSPGGWNSDYNGPGFITAAAIGSCAYSGFGGADDASTFVEVTCIEGVGGHWEATVTRVGDMTNPVEVFTAPLVTSDECPYGHSWTSADGGTLTL